MGLSVTLVRLVFIIATLLGGWGLVVYLALWALMPISPEGPLFGEDDPGAAEPPRDHLDPR